MGNVSRAMYPSTLMQSVIGAQYGVLYRLFVGIASESTITLSLGKGLGKM